MSSSVWRAGAAVHFGTHPTPPPPAMVWLSSCSCHPQDLEVLFQPFPAQHYPSPQQTQHSGPQVPPACCSLPAWRGCPSHPQFGKTSPILLPQTVFFPKAFPLPSSGLLCVHGLSFQTMLMSMCSFCYLLFLAAAVVTAAFTGSCSTEMVAVLRTGY